MSRCTRREVLAAVAAVPVAMYLGETVAAAAAPTRVRYDARSQNGQAMLTKYANAVKQMKATPDGDPRSWTFQWYTHWVPPDFQPNRKPDAIKKIYPAPSAWRDLADAMWNTCQAHDPSMDENYFLPWHRQFLFYFEEIIRGVIQDDTFTLPYWDYSVADPTIHGILPPEFRKPNDAVFGSLYEQKRIPSVNNGDPIDKGQTGSPLGLDSLTQCSYGQQGAEQGFCMAVDFGLHGNVHVEVGAGNNMGTIPNAAGDPIFWLHHCNIDRLWASWNAGGRTNAAMHQKFTFADRDGKRVDADVADFLDLSQLNYGYDRLESVSKCPPEIEVAMAAAANSSKSVARVPPAAVRLGAKPVSVTIEPVAEREGAPTIGLDARMSALPAEHRLFLVLKGLEAEVPPGQVYELFLNMPPNAAEEDRKAHYVGTVNFFHVAGHQHPGQGKGAERFDSFDITKLARSLQSQKRLGEKLTLTIAPAGETAAESQPVVGQISIVEQ